MSVFKGVEKCSDGIDSWILIGLILRFIARLDVLQRGGSGWSQKLSVCIALAVVVWASKCQSETADIQ